MQLHQPGSFLHAFAISASSGNSSVVRYARLYTRAVAWNLPSWTLFPEVHAGSMILRISFSLLETIYALAGLTFSYASEQRWPTPPSSWIPIVYPDDQGCSILSKAYEFSSHFLLVRHHVKSRCLRGLRCIRRCIPADATPFVDSRWYRNFPLDKLGVKKQRELTWLTQKLSTRNIGWMA